MTDAAASGSRSSAPATGGAASTPSRSRPRRTRRWCAVVGRDPGAHRGSGPPSSASPGYVDLEEMLDRERPDLVSVCLPNEGHFEPTLRIIRAGFPLLVEKPLVFDLDEADTLLAEAAERDLFFAHQLQPPLRQAGAAGRTRRSRAATWGG